jgi:hypothetical protein
VWYAKQDGLARPKARPAGLRALRKGATTRYLARGARYNFLFRALGLDVGDDEMPFIHSVIDDLLSPMTPTLSL